MTENNAIDTLYADLREGRGRERIDQNNVAALRERARRAGDSALADELDRWGADTPPDAGPLESLGRAISAPVREAAAEEDPALRRR